MLSKLSHKSQLFRASTVHESIHIRALMISLIGNTNKCTSIKIHTLTCALFGIIC